MQKILNCTMKQEKSLWIEEGGVAIYVHEKIRK